MTIHVFATATFFCCMWLCLFICAPVSSSSRSRHIASHNVILISHICMCILLPSANRIEAHSLYLYLYLYRLNTNIVHNVWLWRDFGCYFLFWHLQLCMRLKCVRSLNLPFFLLLFVSVRQRQMEEKKKHPLLYSIQNECHFIFIRALVP